MTLFVHDKCFLEHDVPGHPESAERLRSLIDHLQGSSLWTKLSSIKPLEASEEDLALVHMPEYVQSIHDFCRSGEEWIDSDTYALPISYEVACYAAGAVIAAIKAISKGKDRTAFCAVRPPGHHATPDQAMGFCLFNNIAIGARYIQKKKLGSRVLIIDWDVHHGNGTQEIFWKDPSVAYLSVHRYPFYPGTGSAQEQGEGEGKGTIYNLPFGLEVGTDEILYRTEEKIQEAADKIRPDWILISCGFDAYKKDPIGGFGFDESSYARLTKFVKSIAQEYAEGRIVSCLEGGYNIKAMGPLAEAHIEALVK